VIHTSLRVALELPKQVEPRDLGNAVGFAFHPLMGPELAYNLEELARHVRQLSGLFEGKDVRL